VSYHVYTEILIRRSKHHRKVGSAGKVNQWQPSAAWRSGGGAILQAEQESPGQVEQAILKGVSLRSKGNKIWSSVLCEQRGGA
jgi:hypothetical protein